MTHHRHRIVSLLALLSSTGACSGVEPAPQPPATSRSEVGDPLKRKSPVPRPATTLPAAARLSLKDLFGKHAMTGTPAKKFTWSRDGSALYYLRPNPLDARVLDLWRLAPLTAQPKPLLLAKDLAARGRVQLTPAQRAELERKRVRDKGITSFVLAPSGRALLIPYSGYLYLLDLTTRALSRVFPKPGGELDPRFSPDGRTLSFVRKGNLVLRDLATGQERRLTRDASPTRRYGVAEFVAQEELDRFRGYWWSPDGKHIALTRVDLSPVQQVQRHRISADGVTVVTQRYPAAGTPNARVDLGVLTVATGQVRWLDFPPRQDRYLARVRWVKVQPPGDPGQRATPQRVREVAVQWLSRDQRTLRLYLANPASARTRLVLEERDPRYLNLHKDLRGLPDGRHFLWTSERSGKRQIEVFPWTPQVPQAPASARPCVIRLSPRGATKAPPPPPRAGSTTAPAAPPCEPGRPISKGPLFVHEVLGVDSAGQWVFASVPRRHGLDLRIVRFPLSTEGKGAGGDRGPGSGKGKDKGKGKPQFLTGRPGWHHATFNRTGTHFVDRHSGAGGPPVVSLYPTGKPALRVLDPNPTPRWRRVAQTQRSRFVTLPAADGTVLNGRLFYPPGFAPHAKDQRWPGLIYVYGGPHGHSVANRWHRMEPWHTFFAQHGFVVLLVDGRGTAFRGKGFEAKLWRKFGVVDVADVAAAARWLGHLPGVDAKRLGLWGWSYGGFLSVMTALRTGHLLRAAAAVAPVADWSLYDTAYTERYLGLPSSDRAVYTQASPLPLVRHLQIPLLILHGMSDDNVLLTHTLKLAQALQHETRIFSMMLYPGKAHSIKGTRSRRHLIATLLAHFQDHLMR